MGEAATAAAVERYAQADRAFTVTSTIWDPAPSLLGTAGGTVDLHAQRLRPAMMSEFISKLTAVSPADTPDCPLWLQFLDDATQGDAALIRFLRQWCGYSLTGDTSEHPLLFVYGPVSTEKSFSSTRSRVSWLTTAVQLQWRCSLRRGANGIRRNSPCCGAGVWSRRRRRCGQAPFRCRPGS